MVRTCTNAVWAAGMLIAVALTGCASTVPQAEFSHQIVAGARVDSSDTVKVNVDDSPQTAMHYGIQGIPTISLFHKGKEVKRMVGVRPRAELARIVDEVLSSEPPSPVTAES